MSACIGVRPENLRGARRRLRKIQNDACDNIQKSIKLGSLVNIQVEELPNSVTW
ncbi:hypothetical protein [Halotia branconii]|uniref:Uncharacterized protein n=1 Tax=Halotia branconii CENA392 TaxID=1539056 RepID=A0AAJ6NTK1_9CYAN|nr:hypothetical protein [Halotia branconii]WGV26479.1 hypothetical protein QI031_02925 [Halotia branconii CENA392]